MAEKKLADVFPPAREIRLRNGKVAKIGLMTLGVSIKVEAKYGSLHKMVGGVQGKVSDLVDIVWMLVENKEEIGSEQEFLANVAVAHCPPVEIVMWAVGLSFPELAPGGSGKKPGK